MIVVPLCSSSSANSTFIGNRGNGVLIDVGCSYKQLREHLAMCDIELSAIKAVLITHEHTDHVGGLKQFTKQIQDVPVYASQGTCNAILKKGLVHNSDKLYTLKELPKISNSVDCDIAAFNTSHDSEQSVGFTITSNGGYKIAYMTDLGEVTAEVKHATLGSHFAFIESNYDINMLQRNTKYPKITKDRICSRFGHLSNNDSADYIHELVENGTTRFVLAHLSQQNNTPQVAFGNAVNRLEKAGLTHNRDYTLNVARVKTQGEYIAI